MGVLITLIVLGLIVRIAGSRQPAIIPVQSGLPDLTITLTRELLQQLVAESLQNVSIPLVQLSTPSIELQPDALLILQVRGDTVLLGGQLITLRLRVVPAATGVQVQTESADVSGLGNVAAPITQQLDDQINAELARRLAFAEQFEVMDVRSTTSELIVEARLRQ